MTVSLKREVETGATPVAARVLDRVVMRRVGDLVPYAANARTHSPEQVEQIARSIREFGFVNPVLVDSDSGIIAGHGRVLAAQVLGLTEVPTLDVHWLTPEQRRAYILADNQIALNAGWDDALLQQELGALREIGFDLTVLGFADERLDDLLTSVQQPPPEPDAAPPLTRHAHSKLGDLWQLGQHYVLCGDSTKRAELERLMGGELADVVWTDPPYNVGYEGGTPDALTIENDSMDDTSFRQFLADALRSIAAVMRPGAALYVAHADTEGLNFRSAFKTAGLKLASCLVWKKNSLVLGRSDYQWMHEPILYGWKPGRRHRWFGGRKKTTVQQIGESFGFVRMDDGRWQISLGDAVLLIDADATVEELVPTVMFHEKPRRSEDHPTMKPVALIERMLRNSARAGDLVLDAFGGSGSTLIAAEQLGMRAYLCELDPRYCDVIVRRWQEFTGRRAAHAENGRPFPA